MKSINAMASLTELGLITKPGLCGLIRECACLLVHPSLWIRQATAGFVATAAKNMTLLDVQCKLIPILSNYMQYSLIQIDKYVIMIHYIVFWYHMVFFFRPELVLESLVNPIPRQVYDNIVRHPEIEAFLDNLQKRKAARDMIESGRPIPTFDVFLEIPSSLKKVYNQHFSFVDQCVN